jgi:hypothetical protein
MLNCWDFKTRSDKLFVINHNHGFKVSHFLKRRIQQPISNYRYKLSSEVIRWKYWYKNENIVSEFVELGVWEWEWFLKVDLLKVCIIRLDHICFEKSSSTFWQVRCCAVVKSTTKFFSNFVAFSENPNFTKIQNLFALYKQKSEP